MKKAFALLFFLITLIMAVSCSKISNVSQSPNIVEASSGANENSVSADNPVNVYAVLAEKDSYSDVGMTSLLVDYIDIKRLRGALEQMGWPAEQIHELKEFDQDSLKTELDWLEENSDANDLVFFYVTGHGTYLRHNINWNSFFPDEWAQIASHNRVLVVDSCSAAEFTNPIKADPNPHLSLAAVDEDEYGWKGIKEEGLPIVGGGLYLLFRGSISRNEGGCEWGRNSIDPGGRQAG